MWKIVQGRCEQALGQFKDHRFQLVHLDPPYFPGAVFDRDSKVRAGTISGPYDRERKTLRPERSKRKQAHWSRTVLKEPDFGFIAKETERVLAKNGAVILWGNQPRLMQYYQDHFSQYFRVHSEIIWAKTAPNLVISWKKPMPQHENAWILVRHKDNLSKLSLQRTALTKPIADTYMSQKRKQVKIANLDLPLRKGGTGHYFSRVITTRVIRGGHPEYLGHPTQKALDVMKPLISLCSRPNDWILDPFMGSGTTLLASQMIGRNSIGIDLNPKFCEMARERLEAYDGHTNTTA